jgi:hypothetical protein
LSDASLVAGSEIFLSLYVFFSLGEIECSIRRTNDVGVEDLIQAAMWIGARNVGATFLSQPQSVIFLFSRRCNPNQDI